MLGSFPPPRARWSMEFFYPNLQNDMWRIMGLLFFGRRDHFVDGRRFDRAQIEQFCRSRTIALSDTAEAVIRHGGNASDNLLEVVRPLDLATLLEQIPLCRTIITTGQKATDTLTAIIDAAQGAPASVGRTGGSAVPAEKATRQTDSATVDLQPLGRFLPPPVGGSATFDFAGRRMTLWRMPSSSRAYPLPLERKAEAYRQMFVSVGVL
ncbi:DNA glycosylase [Bacteroidia bacterium]|nr:DNA glycosylase [Bacteroidia bacterium]